MASSLPSPTSPQPSAATPTSNPSNPSPTDREQLLHNAAFAGLIICPAIILLPPRKLDIYTIALLSGTLVSANHITQHYTGRGIATRWGDRFRALGEIGQLPPQALVVQERLRREREVRDARFDAQLAGKLEGAPKEKRDGEERGVLKKVWYGQEGEDWKVKRDQREKQALEEGRGYGGLIMDQIWEVWDWGGVKSKKDGDKDEKKGEEGK